MCPESHRLPIEDDMLTGGSPVLVPRKKRPAKTAGQAGQAGGIHGARAP